MPPGTTCAPGAYSCGLVSTFRSKGVIGLSAIAATLRSRVEPTSSLSGTPSITIHNKHDFRFGIDYRANQMNVGTEAFQDGFWLIGNGGNFTGLSSANLGGNSEADFLLGITGGAIHDQTYEGPVTGRRWKVYRPYVEDNWRVTPSLVFNVGLAWDLTTPITEEHGRQG